MYHFFCLSFYNFRLLRGLDFGVQVGIRIVSFRLVIEHVIHMSLYIAIARAL